MNTDIVSTLFYSYGYSVYRRKSKGEDRDSYGKNLQYCYKIYSGPEIEYSIIIRTKFYVLYFDVNNIIITNRVYYKDLLQIQLTVDLADEQSLNVLSEWLKEHDKPENWPWTYESIRPRDPNFLLTR